jgi:Spy/CpxP family protein refolding chaperone
MRRINIAACSLMLLAAASMPAMAQGNGGGGGQMDPAQMIQRSTDRLMTGITLSAKQADSVKAINARFAADVQAAMGGSDMRSKMTELRTKNRADLRGVLTADQQAIFDKNIADMEKARANRAPPPQL